MRKNKSCPFLPFLPISLLFPYIHTCMHGVPQIERCKKRSAAERSASLPVCLPACRTTPAREPAGQKETSSAKFNKVKKTESSSSLLSPFFSTRSVASSSTINTGQVDEGKLRSSKKGRQTRPNLSMYAQAGRDFFEP